MAVFDLAEIQIWKARRGVLALENAARRLREDWKFSCGRVVDDLVKLPEETTATAEWLSDLATSLSIAREHAEEAASLRDLLKLVRGRFRSRARKLRADASVMAQQLSDLAESLASARKDAEEAASLRELLKLMGADERSLAPGLVRRAIGRMKLLGRFRQLRGANDRSKNYRLFVQVANGAAQTASGVQCSVSSLNRWVKRYNAVRERARSRPRRDPGQAWKAPQEACAPVRPPTIRARSRAVATAGARRCGRGLKSSPNGVHSALGGVTI